MTLAIEELSRAVDQLERTTSGHASRSDLASELTLMRGDRHKLAIALDEATAKARTLDAARLTAMEKIERATGLVKSVLEKSAPEREPRG
jgi:hypothetical protein